QAGRSADLEGSPGACFPVVLPMFTLSKREKSDRLGKLVSCRGECGPMRGLLLADPSAVAFDLQ
ncbi:MAG: hypothetical protein ACKVRO_18770, partial [Micropepsaceae bacterium]